MTFTIDLTGNVTLYGQQSCVWCGAASAQMIMNGYPNPADRVFYYQGWDPYIHPPPPPPPPYIWDTIQANNSTDPADAAWATDPKGLKDCLMAMNPPPAPGTWTIHLNTNRDVVMFDILYWMNKNHYPVATLINRGGHWVVIVGYETDVEPLGGTTPTLQSITYYDPEPHFFGTQTFITGPQWFAGPSGPWVGPVQVTGSWDNNYVAVIEPPVERGRVQVKEMPRWGPEIISLEKAVESAKRSIEELKLWQKPQYAILRKKGVTNLQPILVREEIKPDVESERAPYYYIVPFGFEREGGDYDVPLARVSIIVNAHTGRFEEITAFGKPVRYLPEKKAIAVVARAIGLKKEEVERMLAEKMIKATMMFTPSDITHIRTYPFWKIAVKERALYVDQLGKLYKAVRLSVPGD